MLSVVHTPIPLSCGHPSGLPGVGEFEFEFVGLVLDETLIIFCQPQKSSDLTVKVVGASILVWTFLCLEMTCPRNSVLRLNRWNVLSLRFSPYWCSHVNTASKCAGMWQKTLLHCLYRLEYYPGSCLQVRVPLSRVALVTQTYSWNNPGPMYKWPTCWNWNILVKMWKGSLEKPHLPEELHSTMIRTVGCGSGSPLAWPQNTLPATSDLLGSCGACACILAWSITLVLK